MSATATLTLPVPALGRPAGTWKARRMQAAVPPSAAQLADDTTVVAALRRGDEATFTDLVNAHSASLLRLAQDFVRTRSVAE